MEKTNFSPRKPTPEYRELEREFEAAVKRGLTDEDLTAFVLKKMQDTLDNHRAKRLLPSLS